MKLSSPARARARTSSRDKVGADAAIFRLEGGSVNYKWEP
jgi:hypothetical protein